MQLIFKRAVLWGRIQSQFRITGDDRQKIVEVMRDAARKSSNGVRLLRLYELSFKTQAFGEIAPVGDKVSDLTVGVADREMLSSA